MKSNSISALQAALFPLVNSVWIICTVDNTSVQTLARLQHQFLLRAYYSVTHFLSETLVTLVTQ